MRDVAVVHNPISGPRGGADTLARFVSRLEHVGAAVRVRSTEYPGHATELAREEAKRGAEVVVAVGGDGTVNEVACGVLAAGSTEAAVAVLPRGTSNLVARHLALPFRPEVAADVVAAGVSVAIDVGDADGRPFLACAGIGWDAHVVQRYAARRTGHRGVLGYVLPILGATRDWQRVPIRVRTDDGREADGIMVLILNMRPYASYFRPSPEASATDGLLDVVVLRRGAVTDLARWIVRALRGTLASDAHAVLLRARAFRLESDEPVPYQIDGDVGACTPVAMLVRPGALRIVCPAGTEACP